MDLTNSKRISFKASYVTTQLTQREQHELSPSQGLMKANHLLALKVTQADIGKIRELTGNDPAARAAFEPLLSVASQIITAGAKISPLSLVPTLSKVEHSTIMNFSKLLEQVKGSSIEPFVTAYQQMQKVCPVGWLHLERIEMYPVGNEQGELMFTAPLAPGETCTFSHKEWATSASEYQSLVDDYFESYSERGVAEKTDMSMASENEAKHSLALNFGANVSGGFGPVSVSTSFGLSSVSEEQNSLKQSAQQTREVTEKASARARQEHKVSLKLETKKGAEDSSFRTITNTFPDRALRVDYYRMMRKWRTDLYRYGVRLTYDLAIPNPGARFWARFQQLAALDAKIRVPFTFNLTPADIVESVPAGAKDPAWLVYATQYGATVDPPPPPSQAITVWKALTNPSGGLEALEFVAPPGYILSSQVKGRFTISDLDANHISFTADTSLVSPEGGGFKVTLDGALFGANRSTAFVSYAASVNAMVELETSAVRTAALLQGWQMKTLATIRDAAFAQYNQHISELQTQRDQLYAQLTGKDTLTLRRLEREELLRLVMEWIVGPSFQSAPFDISKSIDAVLGAEFLPVEISVPQPFGPPLTLPNATDLQMLTPDQWAAGREFGEYVKFIHEAIEWENMVYFLFPYFWGSEKLGREKLLFEHPDSTHRDFLRAGYVRVVIPVRSGYETEFTSLVATGTFTGVPPSTYMSVAQQIQAFAETNYSGVPPANPERHARPLLYPQQRKTWAVMEKVIIALEKYKTDNGDYPPDLATLGGGPYKDAWGRDLVYIIPGSGNDYDLFSYGADGAPGGDDVNADISAAAPASLMASWFDYTPTSGLDIELTAKPALVV